MSCHYEVTRREGGRGSIDELSLSSFVEKATPAIYWPWPVFREIFCVRYLGGISGNFFSRNIAKYSALSEMFLVPEKKSREMWLHRAKFSYRGSKFSYGGLVTCHV